MAYTRPSDVKLHHCFGEGDLTTKLWARVAALLMLLVSLTATSFADPVEQRDAGLRQLTRKLIRPTAGDVKIPKLPIPKKTAFVAICTLGTGYAVLILGVRSAHPRGTGLRSHTVCRCPRTVASLERTP